MTCAIDHAAAKASPSLWAQLEYVGVQWMEAGDGHAAYYLVSRNCPSCHSSLALAVDVSAEEQSNMELQCRSCAGNGEIGVDRGPGHPGDSRRCEECGGTGLRAEEEAA